MNIKGVFMKKILIFVFTIFMVLSCRSTPKNTEPPVFDIVIETQSTSNLVEIEVIPVPQNAPGIGYTGSIDCFDLTVKNNIDDIVSVVWEQSSISYGNTTYTPALGIQRRFEANRPASQMVIPSKGESTVSLFSAGQVVQNDIEPISNNQIVIILGVQYKTELAYYTVTVSGKSETYYKDVDPSVIYDLSERYLSSAFRRYNPVVERNGNSFRFTALYGEYPVTFNIIANEMGFEIIILSDVHEAKKAQWKEGLRNYIENNIS
jgi:hypothetical protein